MAQVHINTMLTGLPSGGEFVMRWPETIEPEELDMVEELFRLQWQTVRRIVAEREAELDASAEPAP